MLKETRPRLPINWDYEADVVVVGYGGAGAAAAIEAHDAGATVLILEKQQVDTPSFIDHTPSTRMAAGAIATPTDATELAKYFELSQHGYVSRDICQALAEEFCQIRTWLKTIGADLQEAHVGGEFPVIPGYESLLSARHLGGGPGLWKTLANAVEQIRGIQVLYATPGKALIQDPTTKEILGVVAETGRQIYVKAERAVVLTTGGFEHNEKLKRDYFDYPTAFYANPGNTGDGIKMAQSVGAALWHMTACSGRPIPKAPLTPQPMGGYIASGGYIIVDKLGRRFFDEIQSRHSAGTKGRSHTTWREVVYFNSLLHTYPRIPCYLIFDEATRRKGPISRSPPKGLLSNGTLQYFFEWSKDNRTEIAKGWIIQGETIEELAIKIKGDSDNGGYMDPTILSYTINKWNDSCAAGHDPEFDTHPTTLIPLTTPPYYAQPLLPGGPATFGGAKRNARSQVLDANNKPIPRLYAAGECGSVFIHLPGTGATLGEAFVSGRIAGRNAVGENQWD